MRTESDLDAAVSSGILSEAQAVALRNFEAGRVNLPTATAEKFQMFGGLYDVTAAAGLAMVLIAAGALLRDSVLSLFYLGIPPLLYALAARSNLRAMPCFGMVLLVGLSGFTLYAIPGAIDAFSNPTPGYWVVAPLGMAPAIAVTLLFWLRFDFPPAPAVLAAIVTVGVSLGFESRFATLPADHIAANAVMLALAIGVLGWAIWWDLTDIRRETPRSQIAFWLHCCAGYLITRSAVALVTG